MQEIKFHREKSLPQSPTVADDGIWFIKADGSDKMKIYLIWGGAAVALDVIDMQALTDAMRGKADDNKVIKTSGDQSKSGVLTFLDLPKATKDAEDDNDLVRKKQVDDLFAEFEPPETPKDGVDGDPGETPYIGPNGNWWIGGQDTEVPTVNGYRVLYDQDILGIRNDTNNEFFVRDKYKEGSLKVYLDGVLLTKGNNEDFVELNPETNNNGALINRIVTTKSKLIFEFIPV